MPTTLPVATPVIEKYTIVVSDKDNTNIATGIRTQLMDFLSTLYIKGNSCALTEAEDHTSDYTYSYESSMDTDDPQEYTMPTYQPEEEEKDRWDSNNQYNLRPRAWTSYKY